MKRIPITTNTEPLPDNVIVLADWSNKNKTPDSVKQFFKDSLDNDSIKARYKIEEPTEEERRTRIKERIDSINSLLRELKDTNK
jgi:hypothetical protein